MSERLSEIDGLRALSVGLVFLSHGFPQLVPGGGVGVDIFFVISGFVITRSMIIYGVDLKKFYLHRFFRIVPAMVAVVIFTAISQIKFELGVGSKEVIAALLSYMNWLRAFGYSDGGRLGHYWSLSVEEQFYILWPLFFIFLSNFKRISIIKIIISVIFVSFLWKILIFENFASYERLYNGLDVRVDGLLAGALINFINFKSNAIKQIILFLALGGFCIFGYGHSGFYQITAKPIETIISFLIVCSFSHGKSIFSIILNSKLFQWAGSRSYGIYLWHYPLIGISTEFFREIGVRGAVYIAISLLITCIFSEISYRTIERPAMKLRKIIESKMNAQEIRSSDAN